MDEDYIVVEHDLGNGNSILVLAKRGQSDFLAKLKHSKGDQSRYRLIVRTMSRILERGDEAYRGTLIHPLDPHLSLIEIKDPAR